MVYMYTWSLSLSFAGTMAQLSSVCDETWGMLLKINNMQKNTVDCSNVLYNLYDIYPKYIRPCSYSMQI